MRFLRPGFCDIEMEIAKKFAYDFSFASQLNSVNCLGGKTNGLLENNLTVKI